MTRSGSGQSKPGFFHLTNEDLKLQACRGGTSRVFRMRGELDLVAGTIYGLAEVKVVVLSVCRSMLMAN